MPEPRSTTIGNIQVRDVENGPGVFEGIAIPYNVVINVSYGRERFVMGAFARMAAEINSGARIAYLNRHGIDGGVPVGVITRMEERAEALHFGGHFLEMPETPAVRTQIAEGIDGVSVEFVPGKFRRKGDVTEHYADTRIAAIAGSYAPAYRSARVALRSVARATGRGNSMPSLSSAALVERRDAIDRQVTTIRTLAETEDRALDETETAEIQTLTSRRENIVRLITDAESEAQRRDAERNSLPQQNRGTGAVITRSETVYGPGTGHSFFADMLDAHNRDAEAINRQSRHRMLVADLASQLERRAVDSGDISSAYPTTYYPDLYVPHLEYQGPLAAFFANTPITSANPILVPAWDDSKLSGDTGVQASENTALASIDMGTKPISLTPKTIGGEVIVSRQSVDGANPGTDVIIGNALRELLMRDTEREIALVLEALTSSGAIPDTAGTTPGSAGKDLYTGISSILGKFYAGDSAGGVNARFLPAQGVFLNSTDWNNLVAGVDTTGRPLLPFINPQNAMGTVSGEGIQAGVIAGVPVLPAWAILTATNEIVARRDDARQWKSAVLDLRLIEREGPQSVVFAVWQYFGFAVLQPRGVRRYTYTNV